MGSASSVGKSATIEEIAICAREVLDPNGECATGRDLLVGLAQSMTDDDINKEEKSYLVKSAREAEAYLLSLAVRHLWRDGSAKASELADKALLIVDAHISECEGLISPTSGVGGLYPLRARLVRYRSLVLESSGGVEGVRDDLARRYRMAVLAKDGDGICTVLNLMLRDLLEGDQGELAIVDFLTLRA